MTETLSSLITTWLPIQHDVLICTRAKICKSNKGLLLERNATASQIIMRVEWYFTSRVTKIFVWWFIYTMAHQKAHRYIATQRSFFVNSIRIWVLYPITNYLMYGIPLLISTLSSWVLTIYLATIELVLHMFWNDLLRIYKSVFVAAKSGLS